MREQKIAEWKQLNDRRKTKIMVILDYDRRPSNKEIVYLTRLAKDFDGSYGTTTKIDGRWLVYFVFGSDNHQGATDFHHRAIMFQDLTNA